MAEPRFDEHSFTEEITNKAEAESCYRYLAQNVNDFKHELYAQGKDYSEVMYLLDKVWANLIKSCKRVGYRNEHLEEIEAHLQKHHADRDYFQKL